MVKHKDNGIGRVYRVFWNPVKPTELLYEVRFESVGAGWGGIVSEDELREADDASEDNPL